MRVQRFNRSVRFPVRTDGKPFKKAWALPYEGRLALTGIKLPPGEAAEAEYFAPANSTRQEAKRCGV